MHALVFPRSTMDVSFSVPLIYYGCMLWCSLYLYWICSLVFPWSMMDVFLSVPQSSLKNASVLPWSIMDVSWCMPESFLFLSSTSTLVLPSSIKDEWLSLTCIALFWMYDTLMLPWPIIIIIMIIILIIIIIWNSSGTWQYKIVINLWPPKEIKNKQIHKEILK